MCISYEHQVSIALKLYELNINEVVVISGQSIGTVLFEHR